MILGLSLHLAWDEQLWESRRQIGSRDAAPRRVRATNCGSTSHSSVLLCISNSEADVRQVRVHRPYPPIHRYMVF